MTDAAWPDALLAAAVLAVDPATTGIRLRARAGPACIAWLDTLRALLPASLPIRRCPPGIDDDRLLGGLDLAATLATGTRVARAGLLAEADGGLLLLPMAERVTPGLAARLAGVLDGGEAALERHGLARGMPAQVGLVALDEGREDDRPPPAALLDRLALDLVLPDAAPAPNPEGLRDAVSSARARLGSVRTADAVLDALCRTALLAGIDSLRAPLMALRVARIVAALAGRDHVSDEDAAVAARLVLAPRAVYLPEAPAPEEPSQAAADPVEAPPPASGDTSHQGASDDADHQGASDGVDQQEAPDGAGQQEAAGGTGETVLEAVRAALPPGLLPRLQPDGGGSPRVSNNTGGRLEARLSGRRAAARRGRPIGVRPGHPSRGRLNLLATLRVALPWQAIRRIETPGQAPVPAIHVHREDFRLTCFAPRLRATTIFVVDASGSSARQRLAEAKGCVELLLADCYVRRDQVALVAFRGRCGELLLPPTGSVVRARRALDGLPGGGGTPLAAGLDAALALAAQLRRGGEAAMLVLLTDGRANVSRAGAADRVQARQDALDAAARIRAAALPALFVDISLRPGEQAAELAAGMGARYLLLPDADAGALSQAVRVGTKGLAFGNR